MRTIWILAFVLTFCGCEAANPILGSWEVDSARSAPGTAQGLELSGSSRLEFLEDRMQAGSSSLSVTYSVEQDRVTVTTLQGHGTVYRFGEEDQMSVDSPLGQIIFRRVE